MEICKDMPHTLDFANKEVRDIIKVGSDEYLDTANDLKKSLKLLGSKLSKVNDAVETFMHEHDSLDKDLADDLKTKFESLLEITNVYVHAMKISVFFHAVKSVHEKTEGELFYLNEQFDDFMLKFIELPNDKQFQKLINKF